MSVRRMSNAKLETAKSLGASFVTEPTLIKYQDNVGYLIECTSVTGNTGLFSIEARIKIADKIYSKWIPLSLTIPPQLNDADVDFEISLNQVPYSEVRLSFADSGGDGVANIFVSSKGIGG